MLWTRSVSPQNAHVETLLLPSAGIRRWGFWEVNRIRQGYEGRTPMNGLERVCFLSVLCHRRIEKTAICSECLFTTSLLF